MQTKTFSHKMKKTEVLWKTRPHEVLAEIAKLLGTDSATTNTPGWFSERMPAMGNILARMTMSEKEELDREGERLQREGNTEEDKRRSVPRLCRLSPSLTVVQDSRKVQCPKIRPISQKEFP
jgi:hypothetical protein